MCSSDLSESPDVKNYTAEPFGALKQKGEARNLTQLRSLAKFRADKEPREHADLLNQLVKAIEARDEFNKSIPRVMVMEDQKQPRDTFMLVRGAYNKPTDKATAAFPAALLATANFNAMNLAALAVEALLRRLRGEAVPPQIMLPTTIVDAGNANDFDLPFEQRPCLNWAAATAATTKR